MKNIATAFVIGCLVAGGATYAALNTKTQPVVTQKDNELSGYTKYTDFLEAGKQSIREQAKFMAATVLRKETFTREIKKKQLVFSSDATITISYTGEYTFGYDLNPGSYEIRELGRGIEVVFKNKPMLMGTPGIISRRHSIPSSGWLINEQAAVIEIYEGMDKIVRENGAKIATEEAVMALCEKKLIAFLSDFLARQPGVKKLPHITISYKG